MLTERIKCKKGIEVEKERSEKGSPNGVLGEEIINIGLLEVSFERQ